MTRGLGCAERRPPQPPASPARERLPPVRGEPLEDLEVELARLDSQQVAGWPRGETRLVAGCRAEQLAEPRDVVPQRVIGRVDALLGEELAGSAGRARRRGCAQQEQGEQRALLRAPGGDGDAVHPNRERAQDPELETSRCHVDSVKSRAARPR